MKTIGMRNRRCRRNGGEIGREWVDEAGGCEKRSLISLSITVTLVIDSFGPLVVVGVGVGVVVDAVQWMV